MQNVYRSCYLPELYKKKGIIFGDYEYIPSPKYKGFGEVVKDTHYIVNEETELPNIEYCSYCENNLKFIIKKYKSKPYFLRRIPPPKARDLNLVDKFVFIIAYPYAKCSKCGSDYLSGGLSDIDESRNVALKINKLVDFVKRFGEYEIEDIKKTDRELRNLDNWSSEIIKIRSIDLYSG